MHPALQPAFSRLEQQRETLAAYLQTLPPAQTDHSPASGTWSVAQVVSHLRLVEAATYSYLLKKLEYRTDIPHVSLFSRIRMSLLILNMYSPLKYKAPKGTFSPPEVSLKAEMAAWEAGRAALKETLNQLPEEYVHLGIMKHLYAGKVSIGQMLHFYFHHADRHIRQIKGIAKQMAG